MVQNWLIDELIANEHEGFIYQQDGASPHWKLSVRAYLNHNLQFFSLGICEKHGLCPPSSCKCKRAQTKNHYHTEESHAGHAALCLGGVRLLT